MWGNVDVFRVDHVRLHEPWIVLEDESRISRLWTGHQWTVFVYQHSKCACREHPRFLLIELIGRHRRHRFPQHSLPILAPHWVTGVWHDHGAIWSLQGRRGVLWQEVLGAGYSQISWVQCCWRMVGCWVTSKIWPFSYWNIWFVWGSPILRTPPFDIPNVSNLNTLL